MPEMVIITRAGAFAGPATLITCLNVLRAGINATFEPTEISA